MASSRRYLDLLEHHAKLHIAKASGYSGDHNEDTWINFRNAEQWGMTAIQGVQLRMTDKWTRLQNLVKNETFSINDESLFDTLDDLAAYAIIYRVLLEEQILHNGMRECDWENPEAAQEEDKPVLNMVQDFREQQKAIRNAQPEFKSDRFSMHADRGGPPYES